VNGASAPGGDFSPPGAEAPSSLDPGEGSGEAGRGDPGAEGRGPKYMGPATRSRGVGLDSSTEMEVEELRYNLKRKGGEAGLAPMKECSVSLTPLPLPKRERKGKKKKK